MLWSRYGGNAPFTASHAHFGANNKQEVKICSAILDQVWGKGFGISERVLAELNPRLPAENGSFTAFKVLDVAENFSVSQAW